MIQCWNCPSYPEVYDILTLWIRSEYSTMFSQRCWLVGIVRFNWKAFEVLKAKVTLGGYIKERLLELFLWIVRAERINHAVLPGSQHKGEPPEYAITPNLRQVSERTKSKLIHEAVCVRRLFVVWDGCLRFNTLWREGIDCFLTATGSFNVDNIQNR